LISQGVPQLGASNNGEMAKTSVYTHMAVVHLPGVSWAFWFLNTDLKLYMYLRYL